MKKKIQKVVYLVLVGDIFHYGHLHIIQRAKSLGDYLICGVETDKLVKSHRKELNYSFNERRAIITNIKGVDKTMPEDSLDPSENLKEIHKIFPKAEIILIHATKQDQLPTEELMKSINGKIFEMSYDKIKPYGENENNLNKVHEIFSTKADTLKKLQSILTKSEIKKPYIFKIRDWKINPEKVIMLIQNTFPDKPIVIRSSAVSEDTRTNSMAGVYKSVIGVDSLKKEEIVSAINSVISSYNEFEKNNQILVQEQVKEVRVSGVVFTRDINGAPYYIINYDDTTGSTDSVTKGIEHKTIKISYFADSKKHLEKWGGLMEAVHELEKVIPNSALDIEFGIDKNNKVIIFQVRPITSKIIIDYENIDYNIKRYMNKIKKKYNRLTKDREKIFSDMSFWNPAEIIGDSPNPLDNSLYDYLILNEMWQRALISNGYSATYPKLMFSFGNKPYIDVTNTFEFLTPKLISDKTKNKLINFYIKKLRENPELHDKIEFELVYNCYNFSFDKNSAELKNNGFTEEEIQEIKNNLFNLTNNLIKDYKFFIDEAENSLDLMLKKREEVLKKDLDKKEKIKPLLDDCKNLGVFHFSRIARFAFIAKSLLVSLVDNEIIDSDFYNGFLESLNTIASDFRRDIFLLNEGKIEFLDFINKYGHLRPGTYNISSPRYDIYPNSFFKMNSSDYIPKKDFFISAEVHNKVNDFLKKEKFEFDSNHLFEFIKCSLEKRELIKFEFTRNISNVLEIIAEIGMEHGFSREEISKLFLNDLFYCLEIKDPVKIKKEISKLVNKTKRIRGYYQKILLPQIIFSKEDFDIIEAVKVKPNFITQKKIFSKAVFLKDFSKDLPDLSGKIVLIENADPGFDWIFTKNISGLITKYGGVASHMAIRCAEFSIPAAIGCGENLFNRVKDSKSINLDCKTERLEVF